MTGGSADAFDAMGTIGIEEEFYIVDEMGRPVSGTDELVYESEPPGILEDRLDHELFKCVIETRTPVIPSLESARETLLEVREALVAHAAEHGFQIAAAGLHPAAKWRELDHAEKPRYRSQLDRIQYPQHRNTTAGLHIHVGIDDADKAVWIANEIRWYLPVMLALSANSPYWNGFDTGLASARATIFESLPNTGMPTAFESISEYLAFEELLIDTDSINDRGEIWYDVRPHTEYGTVEIRAPDAQADPERVMAFVEFVHALVYDLSDRYEANETGHRYRWEVLSQNKWRAIRFGHGASFVDPSARDTITLAEVVSEACARLDISGIQDLLDAGSGAARQRERYRSDGMDALCRSLLV